MKLHQKHQHHPAKQCNPTIYTQVQLYVITLYEHKSHESIQQSTVTLRLIISSEEIYLHYIIKENIHGILVIILGHVFLIFSISYR
ncbi:hypothetical protein Hanom_Chr10g00911671 [Helianthus anomalus]